MESIWVFALQKDARQLRYRYNRHQLKPKYYPKMMFSNFAAWDLFNRTFWTPIALRTEVRVRKRYCGLFAAMIRTGTFGIKFIFNGWTGLNVIGAGFPQIQTCRNIFDKCSEEQNSARLRASSPVQVLNTSIQRYVDSLEILPDSGQSGIFFRPFGSVLSWDRIWKTDIYA